MPAAFWSPSVISRFSKRPFDYNHSLGRPRKVPDITLWPPYTQAHVCTISLQLELEAILTMCTLPDFLIVCHSFVMWWNNGPHAPLTMKADFLWARSATLAAGLRSACKERGICLVLSLIPQILWPSHLSLNCPWWPISYMLLGVRWQGDSCLPHSL